MEYSVRYIERALASQKSLPMITAVHQFEAYLITTEK